VTSGSTAPPVAPTAAAPVSALAPVAPVDPTAPVEPVAVEVVAAEAVAPIGEGLVAAPGAGATPGVLGEQPAKVEVITHAEAERRNKSLKGYQYVPVVSKAEEPLPPKRQRKKINYQEIAKANVALDGTPKSVTKKKSKKSKKKKGKATPRSLTAAQSAAMQEYVPPGGVAAAGVAPAVADPALGAAASQLNDLADKRRQLEMELAALTASLSSITEQLEQRQDSLTQTAGTKRRSSEVTGAAPAPAPKKAAPRNRKGASGRPKRDRKKKTPAIYEDDGEEEIVSLSPVMRSCRRVLLEVLQHHYAFVFAEPVDPVALNIPDYFTIIKNPMDLGTIRKKLEAGSYEDVAQFKADVDLVFTNACTYNMPGSDVYVMSEMVRKEFNKKFAPIERRQRAPSRKKREYTPPAEDVEMVEAAPRAPRTRRATPKKKAAKKEALPMTKEEKRLLSQAINHLPSDNLGMVVRIIQQSLPHINDQAEEIEIDIDALDAVTLRQLEDYVNDVKKKRTPKPKKASPAPAPKPQNKLDQAERTASGTQQKITDIEKQIESLNNESSALQTKPKKDEDVVIDDEDDAQATAYPPVVIDKDQSSDSDSSDSETGTSSDSGSGSEFESDTESESEKSAKAAAASAVAPAAAPAAAAAAPAAPAAEEEADVPQILPSSTASTTQKVTP